MIISQNTEPIGTRPGSLEPPGKSFTTIYITIHFNQWFASDRPVGRGQVDPSRTELANARSKITRYNHHNPLKKHTITNIGKHWLPNELILGQGTTKFIWPVLWPLWLERWSSSGSLKYVKLCIASTFGRTRGPRLSMGTLTVFSFLKTYPRLIFDICQTWNNKKCHFSAEIRLKTAEKWLKTVQKQLKKTQFDFNGSPGISWLHWHQLEWVGISLHQF